MWIEVADFGKPALIYLPTGASIYITGLYDFQGENHGYDILLTQPAGKSGRIAHFCSYEETLGEFSKIRDAIKSGANYYKSGGE